MVINYDLLINDSNKFYIHPSHAHSPRYTLVVGDIRNRKLLEQTLHRHCVDTVVHFAALTYVCDSFKEPVDHVRTNLEGTVTLLESCRSYGHLKRFVYVSTDEVYGDSVDSSRSKTELDYVNPTNPYSASKASSEHFVDVYLKSYNLPSVLVTMCNVYGPHQSHYAVIPRFIMSAYSMKPFTIQGDGSQTRCWLHVSDACRAILKVTTQGKIGDVYNIGSSVEMSVVDLAQQIRKIVSDMTGQESEYEIVHIPDRPYNDRCYHMDTTKIKEELGWEESTSFKDGLKDTVAWYLTTQPALPQDRARMLIYDARSFIGGRFVTHLEKEGVQYVVGETRLGDDPDEAIEEEILSVAPSHVAYFAGWTHGIEDDTVDSLERGLDKVTAKVHNYLFAPLLLAEICRKFNIHFTCIGSECICTCTGEKHVVTEPSNKDRPSSIGIVDSTMQRYTGLLMRYFSNVLNIRVQLPVSSDTSVRNLLKNPICDEIKISNSPSVISKLLPVLLNLMKARHTGNIDLMNHSIPQSPSELDTYKNVTELFHYNDLNSKSDRNEILHSVCATGSDFDLNAGSLTQLTPVESSAVEAVTTIQEEKACARNNEY